MYNALGQIATGHRIVHAAASTIRLQRAAADGSPWWHIRMFWMLLGLRVDAQPCMGLSTGSLDQLFDGFTLKGRTEGNAGCRHAVYPAGRASPWSWQ